MLYELIDTGNSRSFPAPHGLLEKAEREGDAIVIIGDKVGEALQMLRSPERKVAVLIELGSQCLGAHTGERRGEEGSNVVGFARFRLGSAPPTGLVEVVTQPRTAGTAIAVAKEIFEAAGLQVAVEVDLAGEDVGELHRRCIAEPSPVHCREERGLDLP